MMLRLLCLLSVVSPVAAPGGAFLVIGDSTARLPGLRRVRAVCAQDNRRERLVRMPSVLKKPEMRVRTKKATLELAPPRSTHSAVTLKGGSRAPSRHRPRPYAHFRLKFPAFGNRPRWK
jgi:hypothetical protein